MVSHGSDDTQGEVSFLPYYRHLQGDGCSASADDKDLTQDFVLFAKLTSFTSSSLSDSILSPHDTDDDDTNAKDDHHQTKNYPGYDASADRSCWKR